MINDIVFDLDGTVMDSRTRWLISLKQATCALGLLPTADEELITHFGKERFRVFHDVYQLDDDAAKNAMAAFIEAHEKNAQLEMPFAGMIELMHHLHGQGKRLFVCTARGSSHAHEAMERFSLYDITTGVFTADIENQRFDKAVILGEGMQQYGIKGELSLMVGDRGSDVIAAHKNGMRCIGVSFGHAYEQELNDAGADAIVTDAAQLGECIAQFNQSGGSV